jgi:hypothetical protein
MSAAAGALAALLPLGVCLAFLVACQIAVSGRAALHEISGPHAPLVRSRSGTTGAPPRPSVAHAAKTRLSELKRRPPSTKRASECRRLAEAVAADAGVAASSGDTAAAAALRALLPLVDAAAAALAGEDAVASAAGECGVCLSGAYATARFPCAHGVCAPCAARMARAQHARCPYCRTPGRALVA